MRKKILTEVLLKSVPVKWKEKKQTCKNIKYHILAVKNKDTSASPP